MRRGPDPAPDTARFHERSQYLSLPAAGTTLPEAVTCLSLSASPRCAATGSALRRNAPPLPQQHHLHLPDRQPALGSRARALSPGRESLTPAGAARGAGDSGSAEGGPGGGDNRRRSSPSSPGSKTPPPPPAGGLGGASPPGGRGPAARPGLTRAGRRGRGRSPAPAAAGEAPSSSPPSTCRGREEAAHPRRQRGRGGGAGGGGGR